MRTRATRRNNTRKKQKAKTNLARELNVITSSLRSHKKLAKNGWACSCGLCKPYSPKDRFQFKEEMLEEY